MHLRPASLAHLTGRIGRAVTALALGALVVGLLTAPSQAAAPGVIAGVATYEDGTPAPEVCVDVLAAAGGQVGFAVTDAQGRFATEDPLVTGSYVVRFKDCGERDGMPTEYWQDKAEREEATPVPVSDGTTTTINPVLTRGGTISGRVTDAAGDPIPDVCVTSYAPFAGNRNARTDAQGNYRLTGLGGDNHELAFQDCGGRGFAPEWYDDNPGRGDADQVLVFPGDEITVNDVVLERTGTIIGTLTTSSGAPLDGVCVTAYLDSYVAGTGFTDEAGDYSIPGLYPTGIELRFADCSGRGYATEYYRDRASLGAATPVQVQPDAVVRADGRLGAPGTVSGVVTGPGGPLSGACVDLLQDGHSGSGLLLTQSDGSWSAEGLPAGDYVVSVRPCQAGPGLGRASRPVTLAAGGAEQVDVQLPADSTAPQTTITSGPADGATLQSSPTYAFTADDADATFECRINEYAWFGCVSPHPVNSARGGQNVFEVRATDEGGNVDATPARRTWNLGAEPPVPVARITAGPAQGTNVASSTVEFAFSATPQTAGSLDGFQCKLDGGAWAACTSPKQLTGLADGSHTFSVRAVDKQQRTTLATSRGFTVTVAACQEATTAVAAARAAFTDAERGLRKAKATLADAKAAVTTLKRKVANAKGARKKRLQRKLDATLVRMRKAKRAVSAAGLRLDSAYDDVEEAQGSAEEVC